MADKTILCRISTDLLRGRTTDAEAKVKLLDDPQEGLKAIEKWKRDHAGVPHGQWDGVIHQKEQD